MSSIYPRYLRKAPLRYLFAFSAAAVAFLVREGFFLFLDPNFPEYSTFYPTVLVVALLAGLWPALLAIGVSALLAAAWILSPRGDFLEAFAANIIGLVLFSLVCAFISVIAEFYRRSRQKAEAYDKEMALRQSQEALRQQAELLRLSFDAIIVWRMDGGIESWNRGAVEMYGFTEGEALGQTPQRLLETVFARPWEEIAVALRERGRWEGEATHRTKEGRTVTVSCRLQTERGSDGRERVLEINRDITDQKLIQTELQRARDELEEKVLQRTAEIQSANRMLRMVSLCDQALVQIQDEQELMREICRIIQDKGSYPLVWVCLSENDESTRLACVASAGASDGFLDGMQAPWNGLYTDPPESAVRSGTASIVTDIASHPNLPPWREMALQKGFRSMAAFPLKDARQRSFGGLVIYSENPSGFEKSRFDLLQEIVDDLAFGIMSLRARAERDAARQALETKASQLQMLAAELVRTEERERRRIARMLHDELQQLLVAALYGLVSIRGQSKDPEFQQSVRDMDGMLRTCLQMSRSLTYELNHPAFSEPDLRAALESLAGWVKEKHGLAVSLDASESVTIEVEETRILLLQAVRELLFNVVKHARVTEARARLRQEPDGRVLVTVSDSGIGFDPSLVSAIGRTSGGIGLISLRERLGQAGGGLAVESAPGHGTNITVWMPGQKVSPREARPAGPAGPAQTRAAGPRAAALGPGSRIRVLIVDDHKVVRDGLALQLRQQPDMDVVGEAADGQNAVDLVRKLHPHVVTMDVSMPGMGGIEAARAILAESPEVKIIGLSILEEAPQIAAMLAAGAVDYVAKGASPDILLAAIRGCMRRASDKNEALPQGEAAHPSSD